MLGLLTAAAIAACSPPEGTAALLDRSERIIVVGELHGTAEVPTAFAQIVCAASERGPVVVALEMGEAMQPVLDDLIVAQDEIQARARLNDSPMTNPRINDDGRSSEAIFAMLDTVRQLKASGRDVSFHAFQPTTRPVTPRLEQSWSELAMAQNIAQAVSDSPGSRILVLVGGFHARKTIYSRWAEIGLPAIAHLPTAETLTLKVAQQGGAHWGCSTETCGALPSMESYDPASRGILLGPVEDGAYDGILAVGPWTASPPIGGED
ncbi:hypothetical protein [Brevundimonas sp.]|jgi:hypothetical protein|uniref:hypothetical protein n=1 Tax=Brevundimonas sp. TaxID=1871086 RepID=UPI0037BE6A60